ncbi:hypothetical protein DAPPUDRAFT_237236 [Daphnia pulex]|uniref:Uncharacterized protein n=1 Tax=Daphnia pulex TaxID=6669 RepID=E9G3E6_DAPPU|nr:hypothetical protein DAPPUDRAFT_237236 [Daphnia pulex]|eukprot:EFX85760.1 hypothetical protein DAPPUDRAFT_237236 [Daphnia pulex]
MMSNRVFAFLLLLLALATYGGISVDAQGEAQVIEVFQEADAIPSPEEEANGRTFGPFRNFDALTYKENLLHNKISFLFSLVPRPNAQQWNRPPYAGGFGSNPYQQGAFPPGYPAQFPPGGGGGFHPPHPQFGGGGGMIPGQGFYPGVGLNNPYYPGMLPGAGYPGVGPGFFPPGILPVIAENNNTNPSGIAGGGGNKPPPSASASVASAASTAAPTTAAATSGGEDAAPAEEEETNRHKIIKMMPKSFKMN